MQEFSKKPRKGYGNEKKKKKEEKDEVRDDNHKKKIVNVLRYL